MGRMTDAVRDHLQRVLDWEEAHVGFDKAIDGIPADKRGALASGFPQSLWQMLEHLRLAQEDILDFCRKADYVHTMTWPDDYWPKDPAPPSDKAWTDSIASYVRTRDEVKALVRDVKDLTALVPTGKDGQTYLRSILLVADHGAYHVGQIIAVRRALGVWG
ncbi:MAG: DinB family protein [Vicinamibacterales bacterium]